MKKNIQKILINEKKILKTDLSISLLNFNFAMTHIIHKMLALIKNHINHPKDNIVGFFFKKYYRLLFFKKTTFFHNI